MDNNNNNLDNITIYFSAIDKTIIVPNLCDTIRGIRRYLDKATSSGGDLSDYDYYILDANIWNIFNEHDVDFGDIIDLKAEINGYGCRFFEIYDNCIQESYYYIAPLCCSEDFIANREFCNVDGDQVNVDNCNCDNEIYCCDNCGTYHYEQNIHYSEHDDHYYCDDCYDNYATCGEYDAPSDCDTTSNTLYSTYDDTEAQTCINDYHCYDREFEFRQLEGETTKEYLGVELEIERQNGGVKQGATFVRNNLNCVTAHDGSLDNGFEIISDPQTLNYWLSRKDKITAVFNDLTAHGFVSHKSTHCGLHIHVSRAALGDTLEQQNVVVATLELIVANFKQQIKQFSRRDNYRYCQFLDELTHFELSTEDIRQKKETCTDRYQVINTNPTKTIEFRVFRGTLNPQTFFASLQLVHNLVQAAKSGKYKGMTWQQLIKLNNYTELQAYNNDREIHTLQRVKDYTERLHKEHYKRDLKALKLAAAQNEALQDWGGFVMDNLYVFKYLDTLDSGYARFVLRRTPQYNALKPLAEGLRTAISKFDNLYADHYKTLDGQVLKLYDDKALSQIIMAMRTAANALKQAIDTKAVA